jgi:hypothetical protein
MPQYGTEAAQTDGTDRSPTVRRPTEYARMEGKADT